LRWEMTDNYCNWLQRMRFTQNYVFYHQHYHLVILVDYATESWQFYWIILQNLSIQIDYSTESWQSRKMHILSANFSYLLSEVHGI